jgi:hypothetical protein
LRPDDTPKQKKDHTLSLAVLFICLAGTDELFYSPAAAEKKHGNITITMKSSATVA